MLSPCSAGLAQVVLSLSTPSSPDDTAPLPGAGCLPGDVIQALDYFAVHL